MFVRQISNLNIILVLSLFYAPNALAQSKLNSADRPLNFSGVWKEFFQNGGQKSEANFVNGKKNGISTLWYPSGCPMSVHDYKNEKLNGPSIKWENCGDIIAIGEYRDNEPWNGYFLVNTTTAVPILDVLVRQSDLTYYVMKFSNGLPFSGLTKKMIDKMISTNPVYNNLLRSIRKK